MRKYKVVMAESAQKLAVLINKEVEEGYEPLGGLAVVKNFGGELEYYQAIWNPNA